MKETDTSETERESYRRREKSCVGGDSRRRERESSGEHNTDLEMLTWCRAWRRRMMRVMLRSVASVRECCVVVVLLVVVAVAGCNGALD